jgi:hypothetical protein
MAIVLTDANFIKEDIAMDRQPPDSKNLFKSVDRKIKNEKSVYSRWL